jgi:hypothetical protein
MHLPTFSPRRLAAVADMACTAALIPVASLAATGSTASAPRCATSGLVVWANADYGGGYAGGYYYTISFTNLSGHACTLRGYPGVSAVSLTGHQLGRLGQRDAARGQARHRGHRDRPAQYRGRRRLLQAGHGRRAAGLPAEPDRLQGGPDPVRRLPARRAGVDRCRAGPAVTGTAAAVADGHAAGPRRRGAGHRLLVTSESPGRDGDCGQSPHRLGVIPDYEMHGRSM